MKMGVVYHLPAPPPSPPQKKIETFLGYLIMIIDYRVNDTCRFISFLFHFHAFFLSFPFRQSKIFLPQNKIWYAIKSSDLLTKCGMSTYPLTSWINIHRKLPINEMQYLHRLPLPKYTPLKILRQQTIAFW